MGLNIVCHTYAEYLPKWTRGKIKSLLTDVPIVWREPACYDDCYLCLTKIKSHNTKNKVNVVFPKIISAIRSVPKRPDLPMPPLPVSLDLSSDSQKLNNDDAEILWTNQTTEVDGPI